MCQALVENNEGTRQIGSCSHGAYSLEGKRLLRRKWNRILNCECFRWVG